MEVLTAYVRGHAPARNLAPEPINDPNALKNWSEALEPPSIAIQAILTVIGRRPQDIRERLEIEIDLSRANMRGGHLRWAHLEGAKLSGAHLEGANLMEVHLERAFLLEVRLEGAVLFGAHLEGAYLWNAHLEGANLRDAHLEGADLREAHLEGANLREAHLEGADLSTATGLTQQQCDQAYMDESTQLPDGLTRSTHKPPESDSAQPPSS